MSKQSHYPDFDVMTEKDEWDDHTQSIVAARLVRERDYRFLTLVEAEILRSICSLLTDDRRGDIIQYILCHIDETLHQSVGEGQRETNVPKAQDLIRQGLAKWHDYTIVYFKKAFMDLEQHARTKMLEQLNEGQAPFLADWSATQQKALFKKVLTLAVEAYYSHPTVWSEIGYGGPAYPRGYVRTGLGQLDPWEARKQ